MGQFPIFLLFLPLAVFAGKIAQTETVGNLIFKEEVKEDCMSLKWALLAINKTVFNLDGWLNTTEAEDQVENLIDQTNNRILASINHRVPGIKNRVKRHTSRSSSSGSNIPVGLLSLTGLSGSLFGNLATNSAANLKLSAKEKRAKEERLLSGLEQNLKIMGDEKIRLYREQLDAILQPSQHFQLLNEDRIAKTVRNFAGSGRVIDIKVMDFGHQTKPTPAILSKISATVCFLSTASEYPLYKAHGAGQFAKSHQAYLRFNMAPFWIIKRNKWYVVEDDDCVTKATFNATICPSSAARIAPNCNPEAYIGCSIQPVEVTSQFVFAEPLSNSWFIATTVNTFMIEYANGTSTSHKVPPSGVFYLASTPGSTIVIGTRRLPGSGEIYSIIQKKELLNFKNSDNESIDKGAEYQVAGEHKELFLRKITFSHRFAKWFDENQLTVFVVSFLFIITLIILIVTVLRRYYEALRKRFDFWKPDDL